MKILLITQYFPPEPGSGSTKMSELAGYLALKCHEVMVLTAFPNRPKGKIHKGYKLALLLREKKNGYTIVRVPLYMTKERRSFKHRMLNHISFMLTAIYGGLIAGKPDIIYFYSPPIFLGITAWMLKKIYKVPTMMELNDLWPAAAISMGIIKNRSIQKLAEGFEKLVYKKTDILSFYSQIHRQTIVNKGIPREKTEIHRLWVDTDMFCPSIDGKSRETIRNRYKFNDKFVVLYAGKIGYAQGLETVIEAATKIKDSLNILFVLMGEGPEEGRLKQMTKERNLSNVLFIPYQPVYQVPQYLEAADALYAQLAPAPHRIGTIPAKVLSYMSMGRPVIAATKGETELLLKESGAGIAIEPGNPNALADGVLSLYKSENLYKMGVEGRRYALKHFNRDKLLNDLERRLVQIVKQHHESKNVRRKRSILNRYFQTE